MHQELVGIERRRLPFTLIENIILEDPALGGVDILVYLALAKHANSEGICWPSMATLAAVARVHRCTVVRALKHLEEQGYLRRTARFRPDGGVSSNVYQLMPLEARRYPVAQDNTPPCSSQQPPVALGNTNYIQEELDPENANVAQAPHQPHASRKAPFDEPLSRLLSALRTEAQTRRLPVAFVSSAWEAGIGDVHRSGEDDEAVLLAFRACLERAPERVTFFPQDYLRWRKLSREDHAERQRREQTMQARAERVRGQAEERKRILEAKESEEGKRMVERALANLPWRRVGEGCLQEKRGDISGDRGEDIFARAE